MIPPSSWWLVPQPIWKICSSKWVHHLGQRFAVVTWSSHCCEGDQDGFWSKSRIRSKQGNRISTYNEQNKRGPLSFFIDPGTLQVTWKTNHLKMYLLFFTIWFSTAMFLRGILLWFCSSLTSHTKFIWKSSQSSEKQVLNGIGYFLVVNPFEKYYIISQIGLFPQFSGWKYKIFETTTQ